MYDFEIYPTKNKKVMNFSVFGTQVTDLSAAPCTVFKAKTEKKCQKKLVDPQKSAFMSFETKTLKKYFFIVFFILALKTVDPQMLF